MKDERQRMIDAVLQIRESLGLVESAESRASVLSMSDTTLRKTLLDVNDVAGVFLDSIGSAGNQRRTRLFGVLVNETNQEIERIETEVGFYVSAGASYGRIQDLADALRTLRTVALNPPDDDARCDVCGFDHPEHSPGCENALLGADPLDLVPRRVEEHNSDEDCDVDPETNLCRVCSVLHGEPCPDCGGRGYHQDHCDGIERNRFGTRVVWE